MLVLLPKLRPISDWSMSKSTEQRSQKDRKTIKNLSKGDQKSIKASPVASREREFSIIVGRHDTKIQSASRKEEGETYGATTKDHRVVGR
jgi:hypothetical protein